MNGSDFVFADGIWIWVKWGAKICGKGKVLRATSARGAFLLTAGIHVFFSDFRSLCLTDEAESFRRQPAELGGPSPSMTGCEVGPGTKNESISVYTVQKLLVDDQ
ncbi:unnamed protein product [Sphenostylis stenocarpa]|uniref:Uncharacterized protein n=1 Tax=Sphenostylis stenocarpa TaxID=92480 RepID=A0AA86S361_9FABA|nr:unnamed protein product [Sphenostylis stenocarpa]